MANGGVARQALLLPEVVELDESACDRLEARAPELIEIGLELERFGPGPCWSGRRRQCSATATSQDW
jgi:DNA mismatch repair ATPase MutL